VRASSDTRLTIIITHPIQYFAPLFVELSRRIDVDVGYFTTDTLRGYYDEGFRRAVQWDTDLVSGYRFRDFGIGRREPRATDAMKLRREAARLLDSRRDSVLFVPGWTWPYLLVLEEAWRRGMPTMLRPEATDLIKRPLWPELRRQLVLRPLLGRVDSFAVVGTMARDALRRLGVDDEAMYDSHYTVDDGHFRVALEAARPRRAELRAKLGIAADETVFLFVAKLARYKRPLDALHAFARFCTRGQRGRLLLVGDGELSDAIRQEVATLGLDDRVICAGFQNQTQLADSYVASDAFVLPSIEPWGLVLNEAALAGLPLIASELVGAAHDLVVPGLTGSRFRPGDLDALADAMERWTSAERRARARTMLTEMMREFTIPTAADGIVKAAEHARRRRSGR
jgi:glycosyltransferase involved in cell wall biosynthesis